MKIIIVGGGKLGKDIADNMLERKYDVRLIEKNRAKCIELANDLDVEIICGDGTELEVLEEAGTKNADCFISVTGSDQDNLVATQLAKNEFNARKVIVRANNPRNVEALRTLGTDIVVSSTVDLAGMHLLATLNKGKASICTITLPEFSSLDGKMLKDITLPQGCLVISVLRDDDMTIPNGFTVIHTGDEIVSVCDSDNSQRQLLKLFHSHN